MPFMRGMLRSSSTRRRSAGIPSVRNRLSASIPSHATNTLLAMLALENARCTVMTSTSSSSTSRMLSAWSSMGMGRLVRICHPGEEELGAVPQLGLEPGGASVTFDDLADHREADPGALDLVAALEGLEQAPDLVGELGGDADAVVGDAELPAPAAAPGADRDREVAV